jgi:hypothetical protein
MSKRKNEVEYLGTRVTNLRETIAKLEDKVDLLEKIITKSGLIEDLDMTDVLYRTEVVDDPYGWGFASTRKIPFVVNEVRVK